MTGAPQEATTATEVVPFGVFANAPPDPSTYLQARRGVGSLDGELDA